MSGRELTRACRGRGIFDVVFIFYLLIKSVSVFSRCILGKSPRNSCAHQIGGPLPQALAAIQRGSPDPGQRLPDRFRFPSWSLPEGIEERENIETVERFSNRTRIEIQDQTLFLVGFNTVRNRDIELLYELLPDFLVSLVSGGGIVSGPQDGA